MKEIPIGVTDFKEVVENCYYADKTEMIGDVLYEMVSVYMRPEGFGKTLTASMFKYFFDRKEKDNSYLFDHLKIKDDAYAMAHLNKHPVMSVSLEEMYGKTFEESLHKYADILLGLIAENKELYELDEFREYSKNRLREDKYLKVTLSHSLFSMTFYLQRIYHQDVLVIVEDYDVPLRSAEKNGYLKEMQDFISSLFGAVFKGNEYLYRGILIGTLGLPRASVFGGFNNYVPNTISDTHTARNFGFTQDEVDELLTYYHLEARRDDVKKWYGGYRFGDTDMYNPSSVLHFVQDAINDSTIKPAVYLPDTDVQQVIYHYMEKWDGMFMYDLKTLLKGESVGKGTWYALTYGEIESPGHIYTYLLYHGYLRKVRDRKDNFLTDTDLAITNQEVLSVYFKLLEKCAKENIRSNRSAFAEALIKGDTQKMRWVIKRAFFYLKYLGIAYDISFYHKLMTDLIFDDGMTIIKNEVYQNAFVLAFKTKLNQHIIIGCSMTQTKDELLSEAKKALEQLPSDRDSAIRYGIAFYNDLYEIISGQE